MKTLTLVNRAEKALTDLTTHNCDDFNILEKDIDWGAIETALISIRLAQSKYNKNSVTRNANAVKIK